MAGGVGLMAATDTTDIGIVVTAAATHTGTARMTTAATPEVRGMAAVIGMGMATITVDRGTAAPTDTGRMVVDHLIPDIRNA